MSSEDLPSLEAAVQQSELRTTAEIVPVVVSQSSSYRQAQVTWCLLGLMVALIVSDVSALSLHWELTYGPILEFAAIFAIAFATSFIVPGSFWLRRVLTIKSEEFEQCFKRARLEFYENRVHDTKDKDGVLIFVSILEHQVIVLADEAVAQKLPPETWDRVVDEVVRGLKQKDLALGFKNGIAACADLLAGAFPVKSNSGNELCNKVIIKE